MAQEIINTGTGDNDGTGDSIRAGGVKINNNFTEVYGDITTLQSQTTTILSDYLQASDLVGRATEAYVDSAVADLANTAYVDDAVLGLANTAYVDSAVLGLANTAYVDSAIAGIVDSDSQTLSLSGTEITISGGNTLDIAPALPTVDFTGYATETYVDTAVSGLANTAYVDSSIAAIVDSDAQTLSLTGTEITISNGNTIDIANTVGTSLSNIQDETYGVSVTGKMAIDTIDIGSGINASPGATFDLQGTTVHFGSATIAGGSAFNGTINNHLWSGSTAPTNGYVLSWNTSALGGAGDYEWVSNVTSAGTALIDDTSPTLGADLNANTHSIDNVDTITGAPGAQFFVQAGTEGTWPASGENIYVIGYATSATGMFNLDLIVDDQAGALGGIFIGDDNNKQKWPRSNNGQPGAGKVLRTADAAGTLEWGDPSTTPDASRIVYDLANPSTSEILVTDPSGLNDATYYGDVVDGAANNAIVLDISSRSFYGDTYGSNNGDVNTADGGQLILDVDQGDGTALLYGNVQGNLTGSVTHASGTSSFDKIEFKNVYSTLGDLPTAANVHGMFAHVHATGKAYYAHGGNWIELANQSDIGGGSSNTAMADLTDVDSVDTVATGDVLLHDGTEYKFVNLEGEINTRADARIAVAGIRDLSDVDPLTPGPGDVLMWDTSGNVAYKPINLGSEINSYFDTRFATKDTDDLSEGSTNLYYTDARVDTHLNQPVANTGEVLSWNGSDYEWIAQSGGSGTPAGANTQVQFNNSGAFGAAGELTFDTNTATLTVAGTAKATTFTSTGTGTPTISSATDIELSAVNRTKATGGFFRLPLMSNAEVAAAATPLDGDMYYNTDENMPKVYAAGAWNDLIA